MDPRTQELTPGLPVRFRGQPATTMEELGSRGCWIVEMKTGELVGVTIEELTFTESDTWPKVGVREWSSDRARVEGIRELEERWPDLSATGRTRLQHNSVTPYDDGTEDWTVWVEMS